MEFAAFEVASVPNGDWSGRDYVRYITLPYHTSLRGRVKILFHPKDSELFVSVWELDGKANGLAY